MSRENAMTAAFEEVTVYGQPALFTSLRVDRSTVPDGLHLYELRHADEDWNDPCQLARGILVNHYGTVLTREPIQLPVSGALELNAGDFNFSDGDCRTVAAFQEKYPVSDKAVIDFFSVNDPTMHDLYFSQSEEQDRKNACIGHLRGDFGGGKQFFTTWWPHQNDALNTSEFKQDIDRTVNWLREQPDSPLRDFDTMKKCCDRYMPSCEIKGAMMPSCGFMVKTKQYVYMLRCTPVRGDYQLYCYCYERKEFEKVRQAPTKKPPAPKKKRSEPER